MFATESTVVAGMRPRRFSRGMDVTVLPLKSEGDGLLTELMA